MNDTISNCDRLHQFLTNNKFQVPAVFNVYPIFPTAVFGFMYQQITIYANTEKNQRVLHQREPHLLHCNNNQSQFHSFHIIAVTHLFPIRLHSLLRKTSSIWHPQDQTGIRLQIKYSNIKYRIKYSR